MKYRKGFVTNSSSTCYISDITGSKVSGMDISLSQVGWRSCENDHYFEDEYLIGNLGDWVIAEILEKKKDATRALLERLRNNPPRLMPDSIRRNEARLKRLDSIDLQEFIRDCRSQYYELPWQMCPICRLVHIRDKDLLRYALKDGLPENSTREMVVARIRDRFSVLEDLEEYLNED